MQSSEALGYESAWVSSASYAEQYQPEPPIYYPLQQSWENVSGSSPSGNGMKRRRLLSCCGVGVGSSRRNLYRWAKWCSDGSSALAQAEDRSIHVLELPEDLPDPQTLPDGLEGAHDGTDEDRSAKWNPSLVSRQPTPIVSAAWYPSATRHNSATYCFVVGTRDRPVRLIDANDGRNRGTYPILHNEQFLAPTCMAFNNEASKLYAGHDSAMDVFDISQPGAEGTRIKLSPSRKSKDGQKGIVSAIGFSPDTSSGMFAVGTFKGGRISCYSEDTGDERIMELDMGKGGHKVDGQGITQLSFHPLNPYVLFSASRQSDYISVYDIRNPAYGPYLCLYRPGMTQQRLSFDIDWAGRWLTSGGTDGILRVYDINPPISDKPILEYALHTDAIGSVSSHPFKPWILTAYGSRQPSKFERSLENDTESESESESEKSDSSSDDDLIDKAPQLNSPRSTNVAGPVGEDGSLVTRESPGEVRLSENRTLGSACGVDPRETDHGWIGGIQVSCFF